jgi:hypothetical protein
MGENYSVPPLRRQPPAVYGEHGVVYVHLFTVPRPARKTKGHVMLQSLIVFLIELPEFSAR